MNTFYWIIIGITIFVLSIFVMVLTIVKSSDIYKLSLKKAKDNKEVQKHIGKKFKRKFFGFKGSVSTSKFSGNAELAISLSGEKGKGTLFVKAEKTMGEWEYEYLILKVNSEKFDLLDPLKMDIPSQINKT